MDGVATDDFYVLDIDKKQWEKGVGGMNTHCCNKSGGTAITQRARNNGIFVTAAIVIVLLVM